jgi:hypothetical protein
MPIQRINYLDIIDYVISSHLKLHISKETDYKCKIYGNGKDYSMSRASTFEEALDNAILTLHG